MAGLRFAVLLAASSFGVLLLAASASSSSSRPQAVYGAGDEWRAARASNNDGTHQTLNKWAMRHRFYVGDVLDFKHSNDSVLLVRQGDYECCSAASPVRRIFADGGGGDTRFTLGHPGLFYFIGGAPARCEAGQRMVVLVRVVDARSSAGGGAGAGAGAGDDGAIQHRSAVGRPPHTCLVQAARAGDDRVSGRVFPRRGNHVDVSYELAPFMQ